MPLCVCLTRDRPRRAVEAVHVGARSLEDQVLSKITTNFQMLVSSSLVGLPERIVTKLWDAFTATDLAGDLRLWTQFAQSRQPSLSGPRQLRSAFYHCRCRLREIPSTLQQLRNLSQRWAVHLELWDVSLDHHDFAAMANLPTLRKVLIYCKPGGNGPGDRDLRGWAENKNTCMPALQKLFLINCPEVSSFSLQHLHHLRSLQVIGLAGHHEGIERSHSGWRPIPRVTTGNHAADVSAVRNVAELCTNWYRNIGSARPNILLQFGTRPCDKSLLRQRAVMLRKVVPIATPGDHTTVDEERPNKRLKIRGQQLKDIGETLCGL